MSSKYFKLSLFFIFYFLTTYLYATDYKISDGGVIVVADDDRFFDSGGQNDKYKNKEDLTIILKAPAGYDLAIEFKSFQVYLNDVLSIFDNNNYIGDYTNYNNPGRIYFPSGIAKFNFTSTKWYNHKGWEAIIHLIPKTNSSILISNGGSHLVDEPIRFYDSGGANSPYSNKETSNINFYAPAGYDLLVYFITYNTESNFDFLKVSDGVSQLRKLDDVNNNLKLVSSTGNLKFDFKSDQFVNEFGWEAVVYKREKPAVLIFTDSDVTEDAGVATIRVSLSKVMSSDVSFEWCTANGQAKQPLDYTRVNWSSVKINAGDSYVELKIVINDDDVFEGDEKFTIFIKNSINAKIVNDRISCTILDNESAPPELSISDISVDEGSGVAIFQVRLNKISTEIVRFSWITANNTAMHPNDYIAEGWKYGIIPAGQLFVNMEVTIKDDGIYEGDENFICDITSALNASILNSRGVCTIIDNDSNASIEVDKHSPEKDYSPIELVQKILVTGCLTADGITYSGDVINGIGYFDKGDSDFPLSSGIILSTGDVDHALGPSSNSGDDALNNDAFDNDIKIITGNNSEDAQVLEFDFVPAGNKLEFKYIFASEEYPDYACTDYNDVFAFILSGPGIDADPYLSGKNIALIPNTTDWVTINNVNGSHDNGSNSSCGSSAYYVDESSGYATSFNGRTQILKANADVVPCETYHIRLIISDVNDDQYNSAVFLETGSFKTNEVVIKNGLGGSEDLDIMYEGCDGSFLKFTREGNIDNDFTFHIEISGTAENGVDFVQATPLGVELGAFPDQITIPANETEVTYYYKAVSDNLIEGDEYFRISFLKGCPCSSTPEYYTKDIQIIDIPEIEVTIPSNVQCMSGIPVATITIELKNGLNSANYEYSIDGGTYHEDNVFTITNPVVGADYIVSVRDKFSCNPASSFTVTIPPVVPVESHAGPDKNICEGDVVQLSGSGGIYYEWNCLPVSGLSHLSNVNVSNPTVDESIPFGIYTYILTVKESSSSSASCVSTDEMVLTVNENAHFSIETDKTEYCNGEQIQLSSSILNSNTGDSYLWNAVADIANSGVANTTAICYVSSLSSKDFSLKVTKSNGCYNTESVLGVFIYPSPEISLNALSNICADLSDGQLHINASGGTPFGSSPFYTYSWNHDTLLTLPSASGLSAGSYTVTVSDSKNCSIDKTFDVSQKPKPIGIFHD